MQFLNLQNGHLFPLNFFLKHHKSLINSFGTRVVHNPAFLIPLVEKNGNPAIFAVIQAIFENSGKK